MRPVGTFCVMELSKTRSLLNHFLTDSAVNAESCANSSLMTAVLAGQGVYRLHFFWNHFIIS